MSDVPRETNYTIDDDHYSMIMSDVRLGKRAIVALSTVLFVVGVVFLRIQRFAVSTDQLFVAPTDIRIRNFNTTTIIDDSSSDYDGSGMILLPPSSNSSHQSNLARGGEEPDVVIFGIGDSGTRGVQDFVSYVGNVYMCGAGIGRKRSKYIHAHTNDCDPTKECHDLQQVEMLLKQGTRPPHLERIRDTNRTIFDKLVKCEKKQSQLLLNESRRQLADEEDVFFWGYKNPRHAYTIPIMREAFGDRTKMLVVLRHPYDICSGNNQRQYKFFGPVFAPEKSKHLTCVDFWAILMSQLVDIATRNPHLIRMIRVETLVLGSEAERRTSAECVANLVGYKYDHQATMEATATMQEHSGSYGGFNRKQKKREKRMWRNSVKNTKVGMEQMALTLGYNLSAYASWEAPGELLPLPATPAVC